jgi:hypothetical protein
MFGEVSPLLPFCAGSDVIDLALIGYVGGRSRGAIEMPQPLSGDGILLMGLFHRFGLFSHETVNYGYRGDPDGHHQEKEQDLDKEHEAKGAGEELLPRIDPHPGQVAARECEGDHAGDAEDTFMLGYAADEAGGFDEEVDVEDGAKEYHGSEQMQVAYDEPERLRKWFLKGGRFF